MTNEPLAIGTETEFGKVVKYGPAYWCAKENGGKAEAVSAELLESTMRGSSVPLEEMGTELGDATRKD